MLLKDNQPTFSDFFWNKEITEEGFERSIDLLGFTNVEDLISNNLLPGLNKRVHRAKYLFLSSLILWAIKHDTEPELHERSDKWITFCENWFTFGLYHSNPTQFQKEYGLIGKRSKKIKSNADIYSTNLLISNQAALGPFAAYKKVSENFEEESKSLSKFKNQFISDKNYACLKNYFVKMKIPEIKKFKSSFTMKLTTNQKNLLRKVLSFNPNRKIVYRIVKNNRDNTNVLTELYKTKLKLYAQIALQYYGLVTICIEYFERICKYEKIDSNDFKSKFAGYWKKPVLTFILNNDKSLYAFFNRLSMTNSENELKQLFIDRHIKIRPDRTIINQNGLLTALGEEKISFGDSPSFRLNNFRALIGDVENGS